VHRLRRSTRFDWRRPVGAVIAAGASLLCGSISWANFLESLGCTPSANAQVAVTSGRLLGASRFQLAWLNWDAPRPVFLTALANPAFARDVAALPGRTTAILAVASPVVDGRNWGVDGSDLLELDLGIPEGARVQPKPLVMRADPRESLSWPAWWPDGTALLFQRDDQAAPPMTSPDGYARAPARVEIAASDGTGRRVLALAAWQPSPAPGGSAIAFVRFDDRGSSLVVTRSADGSERVMVEPGRFPEIFSPRYAPDGLHIAFGARSYDDLRPASSIGGLFEPSVALAHGTLADLWLIDTDGSGLRQASSLRAHDPALAWAPDGSQLSAYGSWGGLLVDLSSGENILLTYLTGTTAVAWLP
jgi:hypothetical protein